METKTFVAPAIHCGHCTMTIQREVAGLPGVQSVQADLNTKQVTINWEVPATWDKIKALMEEIGYPAAN
jgi:copper chaperone